MPITPTVDAYKFASEIVVRMEACRDKEGISNYPISLAKFDALQADLRAFASAAKVNAAGPAAEAPKVSEEDAAKAKADAAAEAPVEAPKAPVEPAPVAEAAPAATEAAPVEAPKAE
jgi:ribonuclease E